MPHPLFTNLHRIYQSETQPFRKVHRMIDLFETIIKSHTVVILSAYVQQNKLSDAAKGLLSASLRTPSLGTWQLFSRVLFEELQADGYSWLLPDFPEEFAQLDKALNNDKTNVIAFRNGYAHGATPTDAQCEEDIQKFTPFLEKLIASKWLSNASLEVREKKVWLTSGEAALCMHPVLVHREQDGDNPFAFFNDLKNDKVGLLNYPLSKHYRDKDFYQEFHEYLPLQEWKKSGNSDFAQRIEELTETFKGRIAERAEIIDFVFAKNKGYFSIQGNPGIGKSALIAKVFKELKRHPEASTIHQVEYFIRRGTQQAQIDYLLNYLIKRTDDVFPQGREIRAEGKMTFDLQNQLFSKWRQWAEHSQGKKLLFLIDGLDEGVENNVLAYMPRENFENILIIYGSRPGGHKSIDELWATLPTTHHTKLELSGLSKADIRALIYDVANKYEVERESSWIDAVQQRSQGNPLYLKLLCNAIENGSIAVNDVNALPEKIDEYYKAILSRYAQDLQDGDALLAGLFAFAAAKDYLTMAHLGLINKLGEATVQRIGSTLKEVLYENPLTEEVLDYQLFHESFREYLVKEKAKSVNDAAERIIDFCTGWKELQGSWEQRYALEHYAAHLNESKRDSRIEILSKLIYDQSYTTAQKKVLKGFDASNAMYRIALQKSCELKKEDEMLESALCLVDLKYEEANDAPQVVAMVVAGDIDLALKRIESFGGTDQEGVKRRFILYMLCLMELTLLDSKDNPFRKTAIEKLLNHLDENIPVDHSLLEWNNFFPSYLMFQMACQWAEMGLDYLILFERTDDWGKEWIVEKGPYSSLQFEVLLECARGISYKDDKSSALSAISTELAKQGKVEAAASAMQEALFCARGISDESDKSCALRNISTELAKQGKVEEAASVIQEALSCAREISKDWLKSSVLASISTELAKQGHLDEALSCARVISDEDWKSPALNAISSELAKRGHVEEAASVIQEALSCAREISKDWLKSSVLASISTELAKQWHLEEAASVMQEALSCARGISDDWQKGSALSDISTELAKQGKVEAAASAMQEALSCARGISDDWQNSSAHSNISTKLAKQRKVEEALSCARGISDERYKSRALRAISTELAKQGKVEVALSCARGISDERDKSRALRAISTELAKQGNVKEALSCARGISGDRQKSSALLDISTELAKQGKVEAAASAMQETLFCTRGISDERDKSHELSSISTELAKQGKVEEALSCARGISGKGDKSSALKDIITELAKQGHLDEALSYARGISDEGDKSSALTSISTELAKQGHGGKAAAVVQEAHSCARGISDKDDKSSALASISTELAKQGHVEEALSSASGISDDFFWRSPALKNISTELAKQCYVDEALVCARGISDDSWKSFALASISTELAKQGYLEEAASLMQEAHSCVREISSKRAKSLAFKAVSTELAKQGHVDKALACIRRISHLTVKCSAVAGISVELSIQGKIEEAEEVGLEIPQIADRHSCWKDHAKNVLETHSWQSALNVVRQYKSDEARLFYLRGWSEEVSVKEVNAECLNEALPYLVNDTESIESLLQRFAQLEILLSHPKPALQERLNRTLNVQWLIDIAAQFPNAENTQRLFTNLESWINTIADEDDRDQITLWSKQVAKGKITEEEFAERVKGMIN